MGSLGLFRVLLNNIPIILRFKSFNNIVNIQLNDLIRPNSPLCLRLFSQFSHKVKFKEGLYDELPVYYEPKISSLYGYSSPKIYFHTSNIQYRNKAKLPVPIVYAQKKKVISIWKNMTVLDLSTEANRSLDDIYEVFLLIDGTDNYDSAISAIDDIEIIMKATKLMGLKYLIKRSFKEEPKKDNDVYRRPQANEKDLVARPPVVTIMGHVDHGKTTLLDTLRKSSIVDTEFGGITQHIGAFKVQLPSSEAVTFLDTPGHAAFSAMRSRGANATDLVVLVVAADDGVSPQTKESISMAKEAGVPIIVAINKIDKVDADIRRTKEMLLLEGVQLEEQGGETLAVEISALKGTNITLLVEALVAQAEMLSLVADPKGMVEAVIIESMMVHGRGKLATCIIQRGTLRKGAILVAGTAFAKVRNIFDDSGNMLSKVTPGNPAQIIGWRSLPSAGDEVIEVTSQKRATEVLEYRQKVIEEQKMDQDKVIIQKKVDVHLKVYNDKRAEKNARGLRFKMTRGIPPPKKLYDREFSPRFSFVLKGDVDGSLEAILDVFESYQSDICPLDILSYGVGPVTQNDVEMANTFNGFVYTFNTSIPNDIKQMARKLKVPIREHNIIYRLVECAKEDISSKMPLADYQKIVGEAVVQAEFLINDKTKKLPVAGCRCVSGQLKKDFSFQLVREDKILHEGKLASMKHLKNEASLINKDTDCGLRFEESSVRFESGDKLFCFHWDKKQQNTDWNPPGF